MSFHVLSYGLVVLGIAMNTGYCSVFIVIQHSHLICVVCLSYIMITLREQNTSVKITHNVQYLFENSHG